TSFGRIRKRRPATREDRGLFMCVFARKAILFVASGSVRPETAIPAAATPGAMRFSCADAVGAIRRNEAESSSKDRRIGEKRSRTRRRCTLSANRQQQLRQTTGGLELRLVAATLDQL